MSSLQLKLDDDDPWIIEQTIFTLLHGYLQPSSTKSALHTAQAIDDLFPTHRRDEDQPGDESREQPESFLLHLWELFHKIACQIPYHHPSQDRLAELVKVLKGLVSKTPVVRIDGAETTLWGDLPMLFQTMWEEFERMGNYDEESKQSRRNASCFLARLTRDRTVDWFALAIEEVGGCLEGHIEFRHAHAHKGDVVTDFMPERDEYISAYDWISICGQVLYDQDREVQWSGGGPLWDGKLGLCPGRWQLWKRRLEELGQFNGVTVETRELARETRHRMELIEREARAE